MRRPRRCIGRRGSAVGGVPCSSGAAGEGRKVNAPDAVAEQRAFTVLEQVETPTITVCTGTGADTHHTSFPIADQTYLHNFNRNSPHSDSSYLSTFTQSDPAQVTNLRPILGTVI